MLKLNVVDASVVSTGMRLGVFFAQFQRQGGGSWFEICGDVSEICGCTDFDPLFGGFKWLMRWVLLMHELNLIVKY